VITPLDFFIASLAFGVLTGVVLVLRGDPENSIIGLNIALICAVTGLVLMEVYYKVGFSTAIAFCLIFPGIFGSIVYAKFVRGGIFK